MIIKRVINNNILCVVDKNGSEMIVTGRGIGFKRRTGEQVDPDRVEKIYRMEGKAEQKKLRELVEQIPLEHLKLTQEMIDYIRTQITQPLNESLLITLSDHISFAIQRKEQGIEYQNPLGSAIICYYPLEYQLGRCCLQMIETEYGIRLHEDEATFIALHIVNAELNTNMSQMYDMTKLLEGCVRVVEFYYNRKFDRDSLAFGRFVIHLRYLIQRLFQNKEYAPLDAEQDVMFRQMIRRNCREHYECARRIAAYIETNSDRQVSEEELIYLTLHLKRMNTDETQKKE